jgi:hypothetical protein
VSLSAIQVLHKDDNKPLVKALHTPDALNLTVFKACNVLLFLTGINADRRG